MKTVRVSEATGRRLLNLLDRVEHGRGGYFGATGTAIPPIQQPAANQNTRRNQRHVSVKISSVVSGQVGRYNAKTFIEAIDRAATGNLAEANIGTLPDSDDAIVWHPQEITGAGGLLIGGIYQGRVAGSTTDGTLIVIVGDESAVSLIKVTGNATGGGKYTGVVMNLLGAGAAVPESGNLAESDIGSTGATTVLILNPPELGQSTHDLTAGTPQSKYFPAIKSSRVSDAGTPKAVYIIAGFDWKTCT